MSNFWQEALRQGFSKILGPNARLTGGTGSPDNAPLPDWKRREMLDIRYRIPGYIVDLDEAEGTPFTPAGMGGAESLGASLRGAVGAAGDKLSKVSLPLSAQGRAHLEGFKRGMSNAYGPLFGAAKKDEPLELPTPKTPHTFGGVEPDTSLGLPPAEAQLEGLQISNMLDAQKLAKDAEAAKGGDPAAKKRVEAVRNSPAITDLGKPKPKTSGLGLDMSQGFGFSAGMGSVMPDVEDEIPRTPQNLTSRPAPGGIPTATPKPAGGGGVEVPEQEKKPSQWPMKLGIVGDTLINIGNAIGNPRFQTPTGGYIEQLMEQKRQEQMLQLKRRHDMFTDAFKEAQTLPSEVLTDPRFGSLAAAKAALEKAYTEGRPDDEKAVQSYLTEALRFKKELEDIGVKTQGEKEAKLSDIKFNSETQRRADLTARAAAGERAAQLALEWVGPSPMEVHRLRQKEADEAQAFREEQARWAHDARIENSRATAAYRQDLVNNRNDALSARNAQYAATGLASIIRDTLARFPKDDDGNPLDAKGRPLDLQKAYAQVLDMHQDDIIETAKGMGIRVERSAYQNTPILVIEGKPQPGDTGLQLLLALIRTRGGA